VILKPTESLNLMRIIQEALNNCRKYADATNFEIEIRRSAEILRILIRDNGKGLEPGSKGRGNGLLNMEERAGMIGAGFELTSAPSEGVQITVELPAA
jgi:signal transduction histidine kinase